MEETRRFLDLTFQTHVMKYVHKYLAAKGKASSDENAFKEQLYEIWFKMYSRSHGAADTSGFEHVFAGEVKDGKVTGLHNWIQVYNQERVHSFNYKGFIR